MAVLGAAIRSIELRSAIYKTASIVTGNYRRKTRATTALATARRHSPIPNPVTIRHFTPRALFIDGDEFIRPLRAAINAEKGGELFAAAAR